MYCKFCKKLIIFRDEKATKLDNEWVHIECLLKRIKELEQEVFNLKTTLDKVF